MIEGQMMLEMFFNEAETLTDTTYVVEPTEDQFLPPDDSVFGRSNSGIYTVFTIYVSEKGT